MKMAGSSEEEEGEDKYEPDLDLEKGPAVRYSSAKGLHTLL